MPERPTIVCLCGSTRFRQEYEAANSRETLAGKIVLSVGCYGHAEGTPLSAQQKEMLDRLHLAKIDLADEILVLNAGGYIGSSTRNEINHACATGKRVRYLIPPL